MLDWLMGISILLPFVAAILCLFIKNHGVRGFIVTLTGLTLAISSIMLLNYGPFSYTPESLLGFDVGMLITIADFLLLFVILYIAFKLKNVLIGILTLLQIIPMGYFEFFMAKHVEVTPAFYVDHLSLIMNFIISVVGSLICIFAIKYMEEHEEHLHLKKTRQPRFFFFLVLFLGAMNGLVFANNILWLYFFWEVTTLCSFMLIGHDQTEIAIKNATRALWMNMLGGVAFVSAIIILFMNAETLSLQDIVQKNVPLAALLIPLALLCFAGFTKSAQVPFQSWLLGAMVAPTPVSALLHSSTMVKAGVYLIVRLAPAFQGTLLSTLVAIFGAFTFLTTSALAISQSNGKRILAYSTIANLGLIITSAGINTPAAITAAILLIIFHAISKGLLFLCVGTIEHGIGSRDIEDMRGLYDRMPVTTIITIIGIITMLLPPFGVLLSKWMAIEAASRMPLVLFMLALGSALTVVFWARWAGILLSSPFKKEGKPEKQSAIIRVPLMILAAGAIIVSLTVTTLYSSLVVPVIQLYYQTGSYSVVNGTIVNNMGAFSLYPIFAVLAVAFILALAASKRVDQKAVCTPYMCGEHHPEYGVSKFRAPMDKWEDFTASNYYLTAVFGEDKLTKWVNIAAVVILIILFGVVLL